MKGLKRLLIIFLVIIFTASDMSAYAASISVDYQDNNVDGLYSIDVNYSDSESDERAMEGSDKEIAIGEATETDESEEAVGEDNSEITEDGASEDNDGITEDGASEDNGEITEDGASEDNDEITEDEASEDNDEITEDEASEDNDEITEDESSEDNDEITEETEDITDETEIEDEIISEEAADAADSNIITVYKNVPCSLWINDELCPNSKTEYNLDGVEKLVMKVLTAADVIPGTYNYKDKYDVKYEAIMGEPGNPSYRLTTFTIDTKDLTGSLKTEHLQGRFVTTKVRMHNMVSGIDLDSRVNNRYHQMSTDGVDEAFFLSGRFGDQVDIEIKGANYFVGYKKEGSDEIIKNNVISFRIPAFMDADETIDFYLVTKKAWYLGCGNQRVGIGGTINVNVENGCVIHGEYDYGNSKESYIYTIKDGTKVVYENEGSVCYLNSSSIGGDYFGKTLDLVLSTYDKSLSQKFKLYVLPSLKDVKLNGKPSGTVFYQQPGETKTYKLSITDKDLLADIATASDKNGAINYDPAKGVIEVTASPQINSDYPTQIDFSVIKKNTYSEPLNSFTVKYDFSKIQAAVPAVKYLSGTDTYFKVGVNMPKTVLFNNNLRCRIKATALNSVEGMDDVVEKDFAVTGYYNEYTIPVTSAFSGKGKAAQYKVEANIYYDLHGTADNIYSKTGTLAKAVTYNPAYATKFTLKAANGGKVYGYAHSQVVATAQFPKGVTYNELEFDYFKWISTPKGTHSDNGYRIVLDEDPEKYAIKGEKASGQDVIVEIGDYAVPGTYKYQIGVGYDGITAVYATGSFTIVKAVTQAELEAPDSIIKPLNKPMTLKVNLNSTDNLGNAVAPVSKEFYFTNKKGSTAFTWRERDNFESEIYKGHLKINPKTGVITMDKALEFTSEYISSSNDLYVVCKYTTQSGDTYYAKKTINLRCKAEGISFLQLYSKSGNILDMSESYTADELEGAYFEGQGINGYGIKLVCGKTPYLNFVDSNKITFAGVTKAGTATFNITPEGGGKPVKVTIKTKYSPLPDSLKIMVSDKETYDTYDGSKEINVYSKFLAIETEAEPLLCRYAVSASGAKLTLKASSDGKKRYNVEMLKNKATVSFKDLTNNNIKTYTLCRNNASSVVNSFGNVTIFSDSMYEHQFYGVRTKFKKQLAEQDMELKIIANEIDQSKRATDLAYKLSGRAYYHADTNELVISTNELTSNYNGKYKFWFAISDFGNKEICAPFKATVTVKQIAPALKITGKPINSRNGETYGIYKFSGKDVCKIRRDLTYGAVADVIVKGQPNGFSKYFKVEISENDSLGEQYMTVSFVGSGDVNDISKVPASARKATLTLHVLCSDNRYRYIDVPFAVSIR